MSDEERFPDGADCFECNQSVSLGGEDLEWPENREEILCTWCEKELLDKLRKENKQLTQWVEDLQSGMYLNCVYCGYRHGFNNSDTPLMGAAALTQHVENCPKHPMSKLKKQYELLSKMTLSGILHLKEENKTLQNAQQRTKYTLSKTRKNAARMNNIIFKLRKRLLSDG